MCFVHSSPYQPTAWDYILTLDNAKKNFTYFDKQICFIGHSHITKIIIKQDINYTTHTQQEVITRESERYIINVGSVGQPRDGNENACYTLYNTSRGKIYLCRVSYKIAVTQKKMLSAGLPPYLSNRLAYGQ